MTPASASSGTTPVDIFLLSDLWLQKPKGWPGGPGGCCDHKDLVGADTRDSCDEVSWPCYDNVVPLVESRGWWLAAGGTGGRSLAMVVGASVGTWYQSPLPQGEITMSEPPVGLQQIQLGGTWWHISVQTPEAKSCAGSGCPSPRHANGPCSKSTRREMSAETVALSERGCCFGMFRPIEVIIFIQKVRRVHKEILTKYFPRDRCLEILTVTVARRPVAAGATILSVPPGEGVSNISALDLETGLYTTLCQIQGLGSCGICAAHLLVKMMEVLMRTICPRNGTLKLMDQD
eukprot:Skav200805  [mRNA]  locus=scaffold5143:27080:27949:- [translate_table: standard]